MKQRLRNELRNLIPIEVRYQVRKLLTVYKDGIRLEDFLETFEKYFMKELPLEYLGFYTLQDFLACIPQIAKLEIDNGYSVVRLSARSTSDTVSRSVPSKSDDVFELACGNMKELKIESVDDDAKNDSFRKGVVSQEKFSKLNKEIVNNVSPDYSFPPKKKMVLDDEIKENFRQVLAFHPDGICPSSFKKEYFKIFRKPLLLSDYGFDHDETMMEVETMVEVASSLPEIFKIIRSYKNDLLLYASDKVQQDKSNMTASYLYTTSSSIDNSIKLNVIKILNSLEKISIEDLEKVYKMEFQLELPWSYLGYDNIESFIEDLIANIPITLSHEKGTIFLSLNSKTDFTETSNPSQLPNEYGVDVVLPGEVYKNQPLPEILEQFIPVYVSDVDSPDQIWIQIKGKETTDALEILMRDLQKLYNSRESQKYKMPEKFCAVNNICAAIWPHNNNWHRAIISEVSDANYVEVFYVDYGTRCNVWKHFLRFLQRDFLSLPIQAIKARLSNLKPFNGIQWCKKVKHRLQELCINKSLTALITNTQIKGRISVCLRDVSGDTDININDTLIIENLALFIDDARYSDDSQTNLNIQYEIDGEIFEEDDEFCAKLNEAIQNVDI
ncbi:tudor domain-containing protein 5-like [Centruroides sculpturatus]|uniref:tudor domain-containing protein 5-like n=1 Tax=Centruroides sculpturatus TaxID=218467 RepID=UPI000C6DBC2B|nr:tudor domain-containing protein 5-like [Centruroides sculpturatus]